MASLIRSYSCESNGVVCPCAKNRGERREYANRMYNARTAPYVLSMPPKQCFVVFAVLC